MSLSLQEAFSSLEDPRIERHKRHQLLDIIVLTICAVVSGTEGWEAIEAFGKEKQDWLRQWIALENGIPSHDCIARLMSRLPAEEVSACFSRWVNRLIALLCPCCRQVKKVYTNPCTVSGARGLPLISERDGITAVTLS